MQNLIRLFIRFQNIILFLLFEAVAFILIFSNNPYQRSTFLNSGNVVAGTIHKHSRTIGNYFQLKTDNEALSEENVALKNLLFSGSLNTNTLSYINDSLPQNEYFFLSAHVVDNSVHRRMNYITIDKGKKQGIREEMGVVSPRGLVGLVKGTTNNYAVVTPILNTQLFISAKIGKSGHFGSLNWDGLDYRFAKLKAIEKHAGFAIGDTLFTSGYGSVFPEGIPIGFIAGFKADGDDDFYDITVRLAVDFKSLYFVNVVGNMFYNELDSLKTLEETDD